MILFRLYTPVIVERKLMNCELQDMTTFSVIIAFWVFYTFKWHHKDH